VWRKEQLPLPNPPNGASAGASALKGQWQYVGITARATPPRISHSPSLNGKP
jgi:hypothetical protein